MKKIITFLIFIFICVENQAFCKSLRAVALFYGIYFGPFKIGECRIIITQKKYEAVVYSVGLGRLMYPYYAKWDTWVDKKGYPIKVLIFSNKRGHKRKKLIKFNKKEEKVISQILLPEKEKPELISIKFPVYDELSSFVKAITLNYNIISQVSLPVYIKKSRDYIVLKVEKEITCSLGNEKKRCIKVLVHLPGKSELLRKTSDVEMEITKEKGYPVELKSKLPIFGHLVGKLLKVEVLSNSNS